jgi:tRNA threonylcarbamoyladenosine biosynthesis protein TsaB
MGKGGAVNILAIDTATAVLSAALGSGGGLRHFAVDAGPRHSETLMDLLQSLVDSAGIGPADLNLVACMRGPGSFTGLRIGFAAAKGLALALGIPLVTVPTLDCMAAPFSVWPGLIIPVIDAKKQRFFTALYRGAERRSEYMDASPAAIARAIAAAEPGEAAILLTGPDAAMLLPELSGHIPAGRLFLDPGGRRGWARELFEFSRKDTIFNSVDGISFEGPLYLRKSDAELNGDDVTIDRYTINDSWII